MERKPGRPRALTVEVIAQAALDDGVATFSMPSVARRLGVAHSGLYRYVTDREDLLIAALTRVYAATSWPDPDLPWDELIREIGETMWRACDEFPGLARATQSSRRMPPILMERIDAYVTSLQKQQFVREDAAVAIDLAMNLALNGSAHMQRLREMEDAHDGRANIEVLPAYDIDEVWTGRGFYERKLEIFLTGLAARRTEPTA